MTFIEFVKDCSSVCVSLSCSLCLGLFPSSFALFAICLCVCVHAFKWFGDFKSPITLTHTPCRTHEHTKKIYHPFSSSSSWYIYVWSNLFAFVEYLSGGRRGTENHQQFYHWSNLLVISFIRRIRMMPNQMQCDEIDYLDRYNLLKENGSDWHAWSCSSCIWKPPPFKPCIS